MFDINGKEYEVFYDNATIYEVEKLKDKYGISVLYGESDREDMIADGSYSEMIENSQRQMIRDDLLQKGVSFEEAEAYSKEVELPKMIQRMINENVNDFLTYGSLNSKVYDSKGFNIMPNFINKFCKIVTKTNDDFTKYSLSDIRGLFDFFLLTSKQK